MEGLDEFYQARAVIEDFTANTLKAIPGDFSRLLHIATLRDLATGLYRHDGLAAIYSESVVDQALRLCHQQLFERLLESSLEHQETELRECLANFEVGARAVAGRWREHEFYKCLIPSGAPEYLRSLFSSNISTLLALIAQDTVTHQPNA